MSNIAVKWTGEDSQMFIGRDSFGHVLLAGSWPQEENDKRKILLWCRYRARRS